MHKLGRAEAEQPVAIAEQAVEHALAAVLGASLDQHRQQHFNRHRLRERLAYAVEQVAESRFAVGITNRPIEAGLALELAKLTVMGETPVAPPQLADERMGVGQADLADIGLANVADHDFALDRVALHQVGDFRLATGSRVLEQAQATALVEGDAPAVTVRAGAPAALHQPGEAENDVGRHIGTHAQ
ncbi:hypothetical protein D3C78_918390 [compost metagenome]